MKKARVFKSKMHRFFLPEDWLADGTVTITGRLVHRLRRVLRLGVGDNIIVLDNSGWEYAVELQKVDSSKVEGRVISKSLAVAEPRTKITLYQALLKGSNFEFVLQKCTEIGVAGFVPVICERCVAGEPDGKRLNRWRDIIIEAAEQSRRGKLPALHNSISFTKACRSASGVSLLPWEGEKAQSIGDILRAYRQAGKVSEFNIFIGPEGGFSPYEIEIAQSSRVEPVSLGPRILRAETAGLVTAAVTLYEFGEMNNSSVR
jgi:16S rRNA (uracil1498-N3)-methyltransferase